jgi:hypothetical protein
MEKLRPHMGTVFGGKKFYHWKCSCGDRQMGTVATKQDALTLLAAHVNRLPDMSNGEFDKVEATLEAQGILFDGV